MKKEEKIELLKYLCNKSSIKTHIFRKDEYRLDTLSDNKYEKFIYWGKNNGYFSVYSNYLDSFILEAEAYEACEDFEEIFENKIDWKWLIGTLIAISMVIIMIIAL
jgi:hypothetical protein